jgi:hypothetical protein
LQAKKRFVVRRINSGRQSYPLGRYVDMEFDPEHYGQAPKHGQRRLVLTGLQAGNVWLPHTESTGKLGLAQLVVYAVLDHPHRHVVRELGSLPFCPEGRILQITS